MDRQVLDFQIEGMSIGDSLIEYFSKSIQNEKIQNKISKSNKFSNTFQEYPNVKVYDSIQINVKQKTKNIQFIHYQDYLFC